jgi:hypothetical protein
MILETSSKVESLIFIVRILNKKNHELTKLLFVISWLNLVFYF